MRHHAINYVSDKAKHQFNRRMLLLYTGDIGTTLDPLLTMTLPLIVVVSIFGGATYYLLVFHCIYEALFSEYALDHNPRIRGSVTKILAIGEFHLKHHIYPKNNFSLLVNIWDHIFRTAK